VIVAGQNRNFDRTTLTTPAARSPRGASFVAGNRGAHSVAGLRPTHPVFSPPAHSASLRTGPVRRKCWSPNSIPDCPRVPAFPQSSRSCRWPKHAGLKAIWRIHEEEPSVSSMCSAKAKGRGNFGGPPTLAGAGSEGPITLRPWCHSFSPSFRSFPQSGREPRPKKAGRAHADGHAPEGSTFKGGSLAGPVSTHPWLTGRNYRALAPCRPWRPGPRVGVWLTKTAPIPLYYGPARRTGGERAVGRNWGPPPGDFQTPSIPRNGLEAGEKAGPFQRKAAFGNDRKPGPCLFKGPHGPFV